MTLTGQVIGGDAAPFVAGDSVRLTFATVDSAGAAVDLSGGSARFGLYDHALATSATVASLEKVCDLSDAANGNIALDLAPADTAALPPGRYYFELEFVDNAGAISTIATGEFWITAQRLT